MAGQRIIGDFGGIEDPIRVVPPKKRGSRRVWYKPNHRSFGKFMRSEQMRDVTEEVAIDVAVSAMLNYPKPSSRTPANAAGPPIYRVKRNSGLIKVGGNLRVKVLIEAQGEAAMRAEFGRRGEQRYRNLARAASKYGEWKPVD